jgi:plastocyanin
VAQRVVWTVIVAFFALLFVLAPAKIIREQNRSDEPLEEQPASTSEAEPAGDAEPAGTAGTLVTMEGLKFQPTRLIVDKGATVRFENKDVAPHTVTASDGPIDSGVLNPGQSFETVVDEPFDYVCTIHPSMKASIELSG